MIVSGSGNDLFRPEWQQKGFVFLRSSVKALAAGLASAPLLLIGNTNPLLAVSCPEYVDVDDGGFVYNNIFESKKGCTSGSVTGSVGKEVLNVFVISGDDSDIRSMINIAELGAATPYNLGKFSTFVNSNIINNGDIALWFSGGFGLSRLEDAGQRVEIAITEGVKIFSIGTSSLDNGAIQLRSGPNYANKAKLVLERDSHVKSESGTAIKISNNPGLVDLMLSMKPGSRLEASTKDGERNAISMTGGKRHILNLDIEDAQIIGDIKYAAIASGQVDFLGSNLDNEYQSSIAANRNTDVSVVKTGTSLWSLSNENNYGGSNGGAIFYKNSENILSNYESHDD